MQDSTEILELISHHSPTNLEERSFAHDEDVFGQTALMKESSTLSSMLQSQSDALLNYDFPLVCVINSGFDSPANPFRAYVAKFMSSNPLIYQFMLSMVAAYLYQQHRDLLQVALEHRTEAVSFIQAQTSSDTTEQTVRRNSHGASDILLLGTLLLGMTSVSL